MGYYMSLIKILLLHRLCYISLDITRFSEICFAKNKLLISFLLIMQPIFSLLISTIIFIIDHNI